MSSRAPFYEGDCAGSTNLGGVWTQVGNLEATNYTQLGIITLTYLALPMNLGFPERKVDKI